MIPLRAEFKGRIPGLVHDQSGSGATLFIEPLAVVELNNQWREAQLAEEEEIRRILAAADRAGGRFCRRHSAHGRSAGRSGPDFRQGALCQRAARRRAELRPFRTVETPRRRPARQKASEPLDVEEPLTSVYRHPGSAIRLIKARHPLLDPLTVVPVDIYPGR